jgi:hypothetical protein
MTFLQEIHHQIFGYLNWFGCNNFFDAALRHGKEKQTMAPGGVEEIITTKPI